MHDTIVIFYQNARGLRSKTKEFYENVLINEFDIILISETWLVDSISDDELFDGRYNVYRNDRDTTLTGKTKGGGVAVGIKKDFKVQSQKSWTSDAEDIWISLLLRHSKHRVSNIHICCSYIPGVSPKLSNAQRFSLINSHTTAISDLTTEYPNDIFLIIGDYNMPNVSWNSTFQLRSTDICSSTLLSCLSFSNLKQYNAISNTHGRILDLVLCNTTVIVSAADSPLVIEDAHHKSIIVELNIPLPAAILKPQIVKLFNKVNYVVVNDALRNTDWSSVVNAQDVDTAVHHFYEIIDSLIDDLVPTKVTRSTKFPTWYSAALINITKEKLKFFRAWKRYKNPLDYQSFALLRKRQKKISSLTHKTYIARLESDIQNNVKKIWGYVKTQRKSPTIPEHMTYNSTTAHDSKEVTDLFADYFSSVFTNEIPTHDANNKEDPLNSTLISSIRINEEITLKYLSSIDIKKGPGIDRLPGIFIRNCSKYICLPVCAIYKKSLKEGLFPLKWKSAVVTPIFKTGDKHDVKNYRPISQLPILSKILEKIVFDQLYSAISTIITPNQHGFMKGRSTTSNLALFINFLHSKMDDKEQVDAMYTDFSKAFDRVIHSILLKKLIQLGIHGDLFRWIKSYISNRNQVILINGVFSKSLEVISGVPQGSHLGPLLFNIYINDIGSCFQNSEYKLYADDMKIFKVVHSLSDCEALQSDLDRLCEYCKVNCLDINISKCHTMTFTRNKHIIKYSYSLHNKPVISKTDCKDLGVYLDSKLIFNKHIESIVHRSYKMLGFVLRISKVFSNPRTIVMLYFALVRSTLEYASPIWNPQYKVYIDSIEHIQNKFIKYLTFKFNNNFECTFQTLQQRRAIADLTFIHRILNNSIDCTELLSLINFNIPSRRTRHTALFHTLNYKTNAATNSPINRALHTFNNICQNSNIDIFLDSLPKFKKSIMSII